MTRHLTDDEAAAVMARAAPLPPDRPFGRLVARDLVGLDPLGSPCTVVVAPWTVVVFVSTSCEGCADLADLVREGLSGFGVIGALRRPPDGLPDDAMTTFVGDAGVWVVGDDAFEAFGVTSAPFFCVVGEHGELAVEGVGFGRGYVEGHCADALQGTASSDVVRFSSERS